MSRRQQPVEAITLREALKKVRELHAVLGEFLDFEEEMDLTSYWPHGDHPPCGPHLCKVLADEMQYGDDRETSRDDLRRIKRARRALGLPAWWERP